MPQPACVLREGKQAILERFWQHEKSAKDELRAAVRMMLKSVTAQPLAL